ncbi:hypothetical protein OAO87_04060 [bacterium]|nr:hypothetical protein [bacterium]
MSSISTIGSPAVRRPFTAVPSSRAHARAHQRREDAVSAGLAADGRAVDEPARRSASGHRLGPILSNRSSLRHQSTNHRCQTHA